MSWARIDDELWFNQKFEQLREAGEYQALSLWFLCVSYCGKKLSPRVTVHEAMMLLCCSEADARSACEVLKSAGLADGVADPESASNVLPKQNCSIVIHDWEKYRSKNEAKVAAGSKGGKKKEELRQAKIKQTPSRALADAYQEPSTRGSPDPDPDPDPVHDYAHRNAALSELAKTDSSAEPARAEEDAREDLAVVAGSVVVSRKASNVGLVWAHWLTHKPNTRRKSLDSKCPEYKLITKALGSYSVDDLRLAIDGMFLDPWSVEKKPEISWALRQDTKHNNIEKFIDLADAEKSKPQKQDEFVAHGYPPRSDPRYDKAKTSRWAEIRIGEYGMIGVFILDNINSWLHPETLERMGVRLEEAKDVYTEWRKRKQETQEMENAQRCCA